MTLDDEIDSETDARCAEFERGGMEIDAEKRAIMRRIVVAAFEGRREERERAAEQALPHYLRLTALAERQGTRLVSEGGELESVLRWTFNGIAPSERWAAPINKVTKLCAQGHLDRAQFGTRALCAAVSEVADRGRHAARGTARRVAAEGALFGASETQRILRAIGWSLGEINGDE